MLMLSCHGNIRTNFIENPLDCVLVETGGRHWVRLGEYRRDCVKWHSVGHEVQGVAQEHILDHLVNDFKVDELLTVLQNLREHLQELRGVNLHTSSITTVHGATST